MALQTWVANSYGQTLIGEGDEWAYFKGTAEPPPDWNTLGFDDSTWDRGPSPFGYGDLNGGTQLTDMSNGYLSLYIRRKFQVPDLEGTALDLRMRYDDGFVAYLNGVEILRKGMPGAPGERPAHDAPASDHETNAIPEDIPICSSALASLVQGENVLAIQGHNTTITSSDFTLLCELDLVSDFCPRELIGIPSPAGNPVNVILRWRRPTPNFAFSEITLLRNGTPVSGHLSEFATTYTDRNVPNGLHRYELQTVGCGVPCRLELSVVVGDVSTSFMRGDANSTGKVDIADAIWILSRLFREGPPIECLNTADVNDDGRIDLGDSTHLIEYFLRAGPSPSEPFRTCGPDTTGDPLECSSYGFCP